MQKYELLKINTHNTDVVEREYKTTDKWSEVLNFIHTARETTTALGLYIRFNKLNYRDLDAGIIYSIMMKKELDHISHVTLQKVKEYIEEENIEMTREMEEKYSEKIHQELAKLLNIPKGTLNNLEYGRAGKSLTHAYLLILTLAEEVPLRKRKKILSNMNYLLE